MSTIITNWNRTELEAFILIFAANADFVEVEEEKAFILSRIDQGVYDKMHKEFDEDNDYERIQKIMSTFTRLDINGAERDALIQKLKELIMSDGKLDLLEENMMRLLKRLV